MLHPAALVCSLVLAAFVFGCWRCAEPRPCAYTWASFVAASLWVVAWYFAISLAFAALDLTRRPAAIYATKLQPDACLSAREYAGVLARVVATFGGVVLPTIAVFWLLVMPWRASLGARVDTRALPTFVVAFLLCTGVQEALAWGIHKALHHPAVYGAAHVHHHDHVAPVALASIDAHPAEVVLWDLLPIMAGPFLLGVDARFTMLFAVFSIVQTTLAHCGYGVLLNTGFHDLHHERMKCNYGGNLFMDRLMGTHIQREPGAVYPRWDLATKSLHGSKNERC